MHQLLEDIGDIDRMILRSTLPTPAFRNFCTLAIKSLDDQLTNLNPATLTAAELHSQYAKLITKKQVYIELLELVAKHLQPLGE